MRLTESGSVLAGSLDVVEPSLSAALVPPETLPRVRELAAALGPFPRCGFEARLGASERVDVQQWITTDDDEPQRLCGHVSHVGWRHLDPFLVRWCDESSTLHREITELWLELDQPHARDQERIDRPPSMSVFLAFEPKLAPASDRYPIAEEALDLLLGRPAWTPWRSNVRQCFYTCPGDAFVSSIGVMLGRSAPAVRINVKRLARRSLPEYLRLVGWSGAHEAGGALDEITEMFGWLHRLVDHITVALDVGARVYPKVGLECRLAGQPPAEPRWEVFLDELVEREWCRTDKRDALLDWPGWTVPSDDGAPWPAELLCSGMLQPADCFSAITRQLGHVKVIHEPRRSPEAKAYFGYFHAWLRPATRDVKASAPGGDVAAERPSHGRDGTVPVDEEALSMTMTEAIAFLVAARGEGGWWHDFSGIAGSPLLAPNRGWIAGTSDEWVTAFVGAALALLPDGDARRAARDAWSLLVERRGRDDGWGWNADLPIDADSTAFALRLADAVGEGGSDRAREARRVLEQHLLPDGGIAVYTAEALPRSSNAGWCQTPHPCVTAAAAALHDERPRDFLRRTQHIQGSWSAYWWEDDEYATALAAEALARTGRAGDRRRVEAAVGWAAGRIGHGGAVHSAAHGGDSAFATALCVRVLALAEEIADVREPLECALEWLLEHQRTHGAWPPSARMRSPMPPVSDPSHPGAPFRACLDEAGVCTTATVLVALEVARSRLVDRGVSPARAGGV